MGNTGGLPYAGMSADQVLTVFSQPSSMFAPYEPDHDTRWPGL